MRGVTVFFSAQEKKLMLQINKIIVLKEKFMRKFDEYNFQ